jgi:alpha-beta hydrolase superfamily lysophospholipase
MATIGERFAKAGIPAVLTMNRGFHAPEFFNDCAIDFQSSIDFLVSKGCEEIVIAGHSLGGAKCAYFAGEVGHPRLRGVVLMSAIPSTYNFSGKQELIANARRQVERGNSHNILTHQDGNTIALHEAQTLVRNVDQAYRGTTLEAALKIEVPLYSFAAEHEWIWFQEVTKGLMLIAPTKPRVEAEIIEGARDHGYSGQEEGIAERVVAWVQRSLRRP